MVPFGVACAAGVWATRAAYAPWLAAVVGLWPANLFYWQYKFDLVPAALLAVGLVLALRGRWVGAGVALGLGTAVKWSPALAAVVLVAGLLGSRDVRAAVRHAAAFALTVAAVHVPLLLWRPDEVAAAYERQSGRSITPESVWYLLLRPFDLARVRTHISFSAGAPEWADAAATVLQIGLLVGLVVVAARVRHRLPVVVLAALAPAVFLLTNRIFSPQFVVVAFVAWAIAAALVVRDRREQLLVAAAMLVASVGNMFVYPYALPFYDVTWVLGSLTLFAAGLALTAWLALRAVQVDG
jgi:hypothetical protein